MAWGPQQTLSHSIVCKKWPWDMFLECFNISSELCKQLFIEDTRNLSKDASRFGYSTDDVQFEDIDILPYSVVCLPSACAMHHSFTF